MAENGYSQFIESPVYVAARVCDAPPARVKETANGTGA